MTDWLFHTLAWTAVLIALVLILRRPVARKFGPQAAYALWLLPFLRLVLPPIQLPSWMAPMASVPNEAVTDPLSVKAEAAIASGNETLVTSAPSSLPVVTDATEIAITSTQIDWATLAMVVWLIGAGAFLWLRFRSYFLMRRDMLAEATAVGESGRVRLVETPVATAPVAFGVIDRVVALPVGFMASYDRKARDLALDHELAHHTGRDLLANFAVQPLFALHWFNPLGWLGWTAMRRDQEAACDARVIANRSESDRMAYANVIAGFAAGPNVALAAPMACPVLGDKSIVHRLKSLGRPDISPRRRLLGRALLGGGVLALPLTASITYAEIAQPQVAPEAPAAPTAPKPSSPPANLASEPPLPPAPPMPVDAMMDEAPVTDATTALRISRDGVLSQDFDRRIAEVREKLAAQRPQFERRIEEAHRRLSENPEKMEELQQRLAEAQVKFQADEGRIARLERYLAQNDVMNSERLADLLREFAPRTGNPPVTARVRARAPVPPAPPSPPSPVSRSAPSTSQVVTLRYEDDADGEVDVHVRCVGTEPGDPARDLCNTTVRSETLAALRKARSSIATSSSLTAEMRAEVLADMDTTIDTLRRSER